METDYKALCLEYFGTTDIQKLKSIAEKYKNNSRGAGRKKAFSQEQITKIRKMQSEGISQQKIAEAFNTTRQTVAKYLNVPEHDNYSMRIDYMYKTSVCTSIFVDFMKSTVSIVNKTQDIIHRAFGVVENPTWQDFMYFLESRCVPKSRGDIKTILNALGLDNYDPLQIVEKTKGKTAEDGQWLKITYNR